MKTKTTEVKRINTKKRVIGFYSLRLIDNNTKQAISTAVLKNAIEFAKEDPDGRLFYNSTSNNKAHFLDRAWMSHDRYQLVFKSCRYNETGTVMDSRNAKERANPMDPYEGLRRTTHVLMSFYDTHVITLLESSGSQSMSARALSEALLGCISLYTASEKTARNVQVDLRPQPRFEFLAAVRKFKNVTHATLTVDHTFFGTEFSEAATKGSSMKDEFDIIIKAVPRRSIIHTVEEYFHRMNGDVDSVKRIAATGRTQIGKELVYRTDLVFKREAVEVAADGDGVNSQEMFVAMNELVKD